MQLLLLTHFDLGPIFIFFCVIISEKKKLYQKQKQAENGLQLQSRWQDYSVAIMDYHELSWTFTDYHKL